ncbi:MAG: alpha/beta hydrolase [Acidimicrobiales bacterium]|nr:alpha/beta hydrolase [Acidimicrobiales bacterium]
MPIASLNGVDLYYEDHGDGPAIVFNHGGGLSHLDWWQQVLFFTGLGYRCVTFDQRGCGLSGGVPAGVEGWWTEQGFDVWANDTLALMNHLAIDRAVIVGMSMGGWNASRLTLLHPERVRGLIMVGTSFGLPTPAQQRWAAWMLDQARAGVNVVGDERSTAQQQRFRQRRPDLALLRDEFAALFPPREGVRGLDVYEALATMPPGDFSGFPVPSLFLVGEDDALQFPWLIEATADAVGGSKLVRIPDAGHCCHYEQAELCNVEMLDFIRGLDAVCET